MLFDLLSNNPVTKVISVSVFVVMELFKLPAFYLVPLGVKIDDVLLFALVAKVGIV